MSLKRTPVVALALISTLAFSLLTPALAANLDDGYPQGDPAPGRTCMPEALGQSVMSTYSGKKLSCIMVEGIAKWWIDGDPLPAPKPTQATNNPQPQASGSNSTPAPAPAPEIQYTPTYKLPASALAKMTVFENVTYATKSPIQRLDIYMPKGVAKPPLVIWTHGGGFIIGDEDFVKYDETAKLLEVFIKNGVAVASVNYRLAQEAKFPGAGVDAKSAIRFLRANASKYGYDPKRFATGGDSAGSYLALMSAITGDQPSVFDDPADPNRKTSAAVSLVIGLFGNVDMFEMIANNAKYPCDQSKNPYPVAEGNEHPWFGNMTQPAVQAAMKSAGLYPFLKSSKALPTFYIFHGLDDCSVSPHDSMNLDKAVKALKGKSTLTLVPGAIHGGAGVWTAVMKAVPAIKKSLLGK